MWDGSSWVVLTECSPYPDCQCLPPFFPGEWIGQRILWVCTRVETP
jgi:hypothetical protein